MGDMISTALQTDGLVWLVLVVSVAGLVRGFAGFGSAMIIMPIASSILSPVEAVIFVTAAELTGPLPNLPAALRMGQPREVGQLALGAVLALPVGLWVLVQVAPATFGWIVSGIVGLVLVLLLSGWRYRGRMGRPLMVATGGLGGFLTGAAGLPGPPVILLYMASSQSIARIRANIMLYLLAIDLLVFGMLWGQGLLLWPIVVLGLLAAIPNLIANYLGGLLFDPRAEATFRFVAYLVIAASVLLGLPIWKG
jgi:uncharacterized protein